MNPETSTSFCGGESTPAKKRKAEREKENMHRSYLHLKAFGISRKYISSHDFILPSVMSLLLQQTEANFAISLEMRARAEPERNKLKCNVRHGSASLWWRELDL